MISYLFYDSSARNHIVYENKFATASIVGGGKQHSVTGDARYARGFKVCDDDYLFADKLVRLILVFNGRNYYPFADTVVKSKFIAAVRLPDFLTFDYFANAKVGFQEFVNVDFRFDGRDRVGFAVNLFNFRFNLFFDFAERSEFLFFRLGGGEI